MVTMCQKCKINMCSCLRTFQLVIGFEPGKLDLTGKCALPVTKSGIKKKKLFNQSESFKRS